MKNQKKKIKVEQTEYYKYAQDVISGKQIACKWVKLACKRFMSFLDKYDFRPEEVEKPLRFFSICKHTDQPFTGQQVQLMPWQKFIIASVYGFYHKNSKERLTKQVFVECGRKQAKTTLIALIELYELVSGRGVEIITAANTRQQSGILLEAVQKLAKSIDPKQKLIKRYRNTLNINKTDSKLFNVSAEAGNLDGFSCQSYCVDEIHQAKDDSMVQILQTSSGVRFNPIGFEITTAGLDKSTSYGWVRHQYIQQILEDKIIQDSFFGIIYTLDDEDDPWDEKVWVKCCPGIGTISSLSYMRDQAQQAKTFPTSRKHYLVKLCNMWSDSADEWIPFQDVLDSCVVMTKQEIFERYKGSDVYVGCDFSSVSDLSTCVYLICPEGELPIVFADCYVPNDTFLKSVNRQRYQELVDLGIMTITPQNTIDMDVIVRDMKEWDDNFNINRIYYDKYCSHSWEIKCRDCGIVQMTPMSQGLMSFSGPTKTLEMLTLQHKLRYVGSPLWTWCFANVTLKIDHNFNVKPVKNIASSEKKIDPIIGAIEALAAILDRPNFFREVFGSEFVVDSAFDRG